MDNNIKKLITILFLFAFTINAQIELSEDWSFKTDKKLHAISGVVIAIPSYYLMQNAGYDYKICRNAAWMFPTFATLGKEFMDGMQGKEISLSDMSYTICSALITTFVITRIYKRRQKKLRKRFDISFAPNLRDEPLVKIYK